MSPGRPPGRARYTGSAGGCSTPAGASGRADRTSPVAGAGIEPTRFSTRDENLPPARPRRCYPTMNQFWPSITTVRTSFRYFWGQVGSFATTATAP